jgi:hypothetical protein
VSISAIFPSSDPGSINNLQNANQQLRAEFQQLTQALQSGSVTNAQQALGALTTSKTSSGIQSVHSAQDLNALASALQSGDLSGARDAYSAVQQDSQRTNPVAAHHHRPRHGGGGSLVLTSGFPGNTGINDTHPSEVFQPVNLKA